MGEEVPAPISVEAATAAHGVVCVYVCVRAKGVAVSFSCFCVCLVVTGVLELTYIEND